LQIVVLGFQLFQRHTLVFHFNKRGSGHRSSSYANLKS
jgi:hypothetical protein